MKVTFALILLNAAEHGSNTRGEGVTINTFLRDRSERTRISNNVKEGINDNNWEVRALLQTQSFNLV